MAFTVKNRTKQTSTTNGTTNVVMTGSVSGFQTFGNALSDGDTTYYAIVDPANGIWEVGLGTWASGTSTLTRTTIVESSSGSSAINFTGSVSKDVFITEPASKSLLEGSSAISNAEFLKKSGNVIEGRSTSEVLSDIGALSTSVASSTYAPLSGATFTGGVTANSGISIDNITIDGTEIDLSSGNFTLDVAGNITLDADDGGHVRFKDGGAEYLSIYEDASNNPIIQASIADTNILFKGNDSDGSGVITALDLDIANAGQATFNSGITVGGTLNLNSQQMTNGSTIGAAKGIFTSAATGQLTLNSTSSDYMLEFQRSGASEWWLKASSSSFAIHENGGSDYLTIASGGNATFAGNITLPQTGILSFLSASDEYIQGGSGTITMGVNNSAHFKIEDTVSTFGQNDADYTVKIGNSGYAGIYVDGDSDIAILNPANDNVIFGSNNSRTYLYYNSLSTLYTDANGIYVRSSTNYSDATIYLGNNGNARIINDEDSYFQILSGSGDTIIFQYNNAAVYLYHNGTQVIETHAHGIYVKSTGTNTDGTVYLGNQGVAQITGDHDNAVYIYSGSGDTVIWGSNNARVYLYHDGSGVFYTDPGGIYAYNKYSSISGTVYLGTSGNSYIATNAGTATSITNYQGDSVIYGQDNSYLYLYYDGSWKARTRSDGFEVGGSLVVSDKISVNNSYGGSGQVLTSNGGSSAASWQDAGGGAWEVIGNYTGTNVNSIDFINGSNGFVFDATTYKHIHMYATFHNYGSYSGGDLKIFPLVGTTSSYNAMSNLAFQYQWWNELYPEFTGVTYGSYQHGANAQYGNNNQGAIMQNIRMDQNASSASGAGMAMFSETINGTYHSSQARYYSTNVQMEFPCWGIDTDRSFAGTGKVWYDNPSIFAYSRNFVWQTLGLGYGKVGFRFIAQSSSSRWNYDITWIGLKP